MAPGMQGTLEVGALGKFILMSVHGHRGNRPDTGGFIDQTLRLRR
jgi:hypothetical protein